MTTFLDTARVVGSLVPVWQAGWLTIAVVIWFVAKTVKRVQ